MPLGSVELKCARDKEKKSSQPAGSEYKKKCWITQLDSYPLNPVPRVFDKHPRSSSCAHSLDRAGRANRLATLATDARVDAFSVSAWHIFARISGTKSARGHWLSIEG